MLKLWGSIAMQDEYLGFWSFPIFFWVLHYIGKNISTLNQAFIKKHLGKLSSKTIPVGTRSKTFVTSTTGVDTQQMSNQKLFNHYHHACKNHSISLHDSSNHLWDALDFRVPYDLEGLTYFWAYHSSQKVQIPTCKNTVPPKEPIPTWNDIT